MSWLLPPHPQPRRFYTAPNGPRGHGDRGRGPPVAVEDDPVAPPAGPEPGRQSTGKSIAIAGVFQPLSRNGYTKWVPVQAKAQELIMNP